MSLYKGFPDSPDPELEWMVDAIIASEPRSDLDEARYRRYLRKNLHHADAYGMSVKNLQKLLDGREGGRRMNDSTALVLIFLGMLVFVGWLAYVNR